MKPLKPFSHYMKGVWIAGAASATIAAGSFVVTGQGPVAAAIAGTLAGSAGMVGSMPLAASAMLKDFGRD